jgi:hypothetical protein
MVVSFGWKQFLAIFQAQAADCTTLWQHYLHTDAFNTHLAIHSVGNHSRNQPVSVHTRTHKLSL